MHKSHKAWRRRHCADQFRIVPQPPDKHGAKTCAGGTEDAQHRTARGRSEKKSKRGLTDADAASQNLSGRWGRNAGGEVANGPLVAGVGVPGERGGDLQS